MITELEFKSLTSQGYNRIPLMLEAFADLETPLSLYLKLAHSQGTGAYSFLLESVVGGERFGRYSFIGLPARTFIRATGFGAQARSEVVRDGVVVETASGNPLDFIETQDFRARLPEGFTMQPGRSLFRIRVELGPVKPGGLLGFREAVQAAD
jgi:anthranilate synthase component 1